MSDCSRAVVWVFLMATKKRILATIIVCLLWGQALCAESPSPLTDAEETDFRLLTGQLADPARVAKTKLEAAQQLIKRNYPQAAEALKGFLLDNANRPAQVAVAQAIALGAVENALFIDPLMAMLTGTEASVRGPAARALATYKNHGVHDKLMKIVHDVKSDRAVRLEVITILQGLLDKRAVDALIKLLDDRDAAIRDAAAAALTALTNIRTFGNDPDRWKAWWDTNKSKPRTVWVADLAESLGRANAALEAQNTLLRERLVKSYQDIYTATPAARLDAVLMEYLKDALGDIRLLGLELANRRVLEGKKIPPAMAQQAQTMLADTDDRVRRLSALMVANLKGDNAARTLLARLKVETSRSVTEGLLQALGQLRDPVAIPAVLEQVGSKDEDVAASAARALQKIAGKNPFPQAQQDAVARVLVARYRQNGYSDDGSVLREALLSAMGIVPTKAVTALLQDALKDQAATVRLAAVNGLAGLGQPALAASIVPLFSDADRGVRQAAIRAVGKLDGATYLTTILDRTRPSVESDPAVQKQAWDEIMPILQQAKSDVLSTVWQTLDKREGALEQRTKVGQLFIAALAAGKDARLPTVQRELAVLLMTSARPAEAAALLDEAHAALAKAQSPDTQAAWLEWMKALLASANPEAVKVMASQSNAKAFANARTLLDARLKALLAEEQFSQVVLIASAAVEQLADDKRLSAEEKAALAGTLTIARQKQTAADRILVAKLILQLIGADATAATAAATELKGMGDRAVGPLVEELRKALTADKPEPKHEKAILDVLAPIAPKLGGYDATADLAARVKCVDGWLKALGVSPGPA